LKLRTPGTLVSPFFSSAVASQRVKTAVAKSGSVRTMRSPCERLPTASATRTGYRGDPRSATSNGGCVGISGSRWAPRRAGRGLRPVHGQHQHLPGSSAPCDPWPSGRCPCCRFGRHPPSAGKGRLLQRTKCPVAAGSGRVPSPERMSPRLATRSRSTDGAADGYVSAPWVVRRASWRTERTPERPYSGASGSRSRWRNCGMMTRRRSARPATPRSRYRRDQGARCSSWPVESRTRTAPSLCRRGTAARRA
jgi:hypothetical protein